jgi:hypothetical protein
MESAHPCAQWCRWNRRLRGVAHRVDAADAQCGLKQSNGSRQSLQRHCALHAVDPKRESTTDLSEP